ncbi:MAG TPA: methylmalonyl Co-A mutase-associated GTPase MeaB [Thermoplasmatales archaeon]|nr:methylmalonyl Co-A mutase-associated GTPase MeaB [Thermoplasmatales archaeon]
MKELASKVLKGDTRSVARLITLVENNSRNAANAMKIIHRHTGNAHVVGVTGVMGSGKSTLIYELAREYRKQGKTVGIVGIDPTSPFTGGALLGDRIRMQELACDSGVFIRSMGTRGALGGLTGAIFDVIEILDASGKDVVLVETVGVGQGEVDVVKMADTTLVVLVPGLGDSIQTIKAGIMEIADVFVVNKADRPGVDRAVAELESMLDLKHVEGERRTPVVKTVARKGEGVSELIQEIDKHMKYLKKQDLLELRRRKRYEAELVEIIRRELMSYIFDEKKLKGKIDDLVDRILMKKMDPYTSAEEVLERMLR